MRTKSLGDKVGFEATPVKIRCTKNEKNLKRRHNTLVIWISTKRTRSSQFEMMSEKSNITMPPEERIEDKSLE